MKIVATIEARMTSSRLPGKVLLEASGKPMLEHLVTRLRAVRLIDQIVLATTTNTSDDVLSSFAGRVGIACFRGSEDDVMARVICAATSASADVVVKITGDCPVIDPLIVEQAIQMFLHNECDYLTNAHIRSYPDGMDTEVFYLDTLKKSAAMTTDRLDHEHVTLHIRHHPEVFRTIHLVAPRDQCWPELGLTLDERKDYVLLTKLIEHFGISRHLFSCREAVAELRRHPDWLEINKDVRRKGDT